MKKNEIEASKLKKLRISRETLQILTSSDNRKVVGGFESDLCEEATSPRTGCIPTCIC